MDNRQARKLGLNWPGRTPWLAWVGVNALGGTLGLLLLAATTLLPQDPRLVAGFCAGALIWAPLGLAQGILIARCISQGGGWVLTWLLLSLAGGFIGWFSALSIVNLYATSYAGHPFSISVGGWVLYNGLGLLASGLLWPRQHVGGRLAYHRQSS